MSDQPLPSSFDSDPDFYNERIFQKIGRRLKEEPLIPLGMGLTCWALYNAQQSIRSGNSIKTNRFFRYRLYAQSFTLVAMIAGSLYYKSDRFKRKEYIKLKEKEKEQEKREQWIRELEIRDLEDKEWRAKLGKVKDLQREEEERLAVLEMQQKKARGVDGQKAVEDARKLSTQERGSKGIADKTASAVPKKPVVVVEDKEHETELKKYKGILGESEAGGLFGLGHLKGFYEHRVKPAFGFVEDKKDEESDKADKRD